jgi:fatty acid synthase subunit alpha
MEVSEDEAAKFKLEHGDKCDSWTQPSGEWFVKFKRGARILVPKAVKAVSFNRVVAGQLPTGWDAGRYGIPADSRQIALPCGLSSALQKLSSWPASLIPMSSTGMYTLQRTSIGSGAGGMESLSVMFRDQHAMVDPDPQNEGGADMTRFTAVRKKMSRKISFRKREFNFF